MLHVPVTAESATQVHKPVHLFQLLLLIHSDRYVWWCSITNSHDLQLLTASGTSGASVDQHKNILTHILDDVEEKESSWLEWQAGRLLD